MKIFAIAAGSFGVLTCLAVLTSSGQERGWYVRGDAGPAWNQELSVKEFLGVKNVGKFEFDTGVRLDVAGGYNFKPWLAAEFETGFIGNQIQPTHDSSLSSIPIMANILFQLPNSTRFVPFIGGGAGGVVSVLDADDLGNPALGFIDGTDSDLVFAWQGFAGVRYKINEQFGVYLTYRYLGTTDPSWDAEDVFGIQPTEQVTLEGVNNHSVVLGVDFHF